MGNNDNCLIQILIQYGMHSLFKAPVAHISSFASEYKPAWLFKEFAHSRLKFISAKIAHFATIMFMQAFNKVKPQIMFCCNDFCCLFCFRFNTGGDRFWMIPV